MQILKDGSLSSVVFLAFVRRLDCSFCDAPSPSEAHHFPPKGRGVTRDDRSLPVCRRCHMRCHGQRVDGAEAIPEPAQRAEIDRVRSLFMELGSAAEWDQFARDWRRWRESRDEGGISL